MHEPGGQWVMQVGRNLLDAVDGFLRNKRYLSLDRDAVFSTRFRRLIGDSRVQPVHLPDLKALVPTMVRADVANG